MPRLLHSRRVPAQATASDEACSAAQPADDRPPCAGVGDENCHVWTCWECLRDIAAKTPKMPVNACANDNWIGRERLHVREASTATKALASLGRCCWKQIRLGHREDPGLQTASSWHSPLQTCPHWKCRHRQMLSWIRSMLSSRGAYMTSQRRNGRA